MFTLPNRASAEITQYQGAGKSDSHLKDSISKISLAFPYAGISFINSKDVIGFAAVGTWNEEHGGWTGIVEFFHDAHLGVCSLNIFNTQLSHGMKQVAQEVARYDINAMPNVLSVEGNERTGFLYHISFYQNDYWKELECANQGYDPEKTEQLLELAKKLDKDHGF